MLYVDEGERLAKLLDRSGSTIGETLRTAWTGAVLGQQNATSDRTRIVRRGTYSLGLIIGYQLDTIAPLLADAGPGTPQRFMYASATDPSIPDEPPHWPGPLDYKMPTLEADDIDGSVGFDIAAEVVAEIRATDTERARGTIAPAPLDGHEPLSRVKVAALLAILDSRRDITADDWSLSRVVWRTSCRVRDALLGYTQQRASLSVSARNDAAAERQIVIEEAVERAAVKRTAAAIRRRLDGGEWVSGSDLRRATPHKLRGYLDLALEHLTGAGDIESETTEYRGQAGARYRQVTS